MSAFDLISDTHIDIWITPDSDAKSHQKKIDKFIDHLIPDEPSEVLVIAGDLGHYNKQNALMLKSLKRVYSHILFVFGNHDLYLVSGKVREKYANNSMNRRTEMKSLAEEIEGVFCLDGTSITIDGVTFGGTGMWYDFSYGLRELHMQMDHLRRIWKGKMNDSRLIHTLPSFEEEVAKLESIFGASDVIVTHVGPDWSRVAGGCRYDPVTSFYYFDGSDLLSRANGKTWCFGHTHDHYSYVKNGCYLVNNALGYPIDNPRMRIQTIQC
ncbi:metallophosphoesterase [Paenibacillus sp. EPM92]|uniref:metallophosphoesterase family protein n=1 Tax=Paenibacillus sp. EPM92 TaxID=1561195 RepID=UPI001915EE09|nr:metallophosphoesterase [Paenibacillus sp. EPM92]